jgi:predicted Na+-dependent transporter
MCLLAALVFFTAAQIDPRRLSELRSRMVAIPTLSVGVLLVLTAVAWLLSRPFGGDVRAGILCLGLASTEVASVGLIGLADGDSILGLGILTGSLIASAVLGPLLVGLLAHTRGHVTSLGLLGRFGLVVLLPLAHELAAGLRGSGRVGHPGVRHNGRKRRRCLRRGDAARRGRGRHVHSSRHAEVRLSLRRSQPLV